MSIYLNKSVFKNAQMLPVKNFRVDCKENTNK